MNARNDFKILDCTLRDGGYYNNWDFDSKVVSEYLEAMVESKIDYVELGLRNFPKNEFLGAFAFTTEKFLSSLSLPKGPKYGVMVDAKTIISSEMSTAEAIATLFVLQKNSAVEVVRVAAHFKEIDDCEAITKELKKLGYFVGLNLMQSNGKPLDLIANEAKKIESWGSVDVLYYADSLGNMTDENVQNIASALKTGWSGALGIHTHDNMNRGLSNTLCAIESGVEFVDSTVTGMGRGAGNTQTELLLATILDRKKQYNPTSVFELAIQTFEPMKLSYGWGSNLAYFLGAKFDIHPTYIQTLLTQPHFSKDVLVRAIDYLSRYENSSSFDNSVLKASISFDSNGDAEISGSNVRNSLAGKEVLVLASGPSVKRHRIAIEQFIETKKPVVISLTTSPAIEPSLIDTFVVSHNSTFIANKGSISSLEGKFIVPKHRFSEEELELLAGKNVIDYGIQVVESKLNGNYTYATIPFDITASYAFAYLLDAQPNKIFTVGFDGFDSKDERQLEMIELFELYKKNDLSAQTISLTPTSYPIGRGSVYAPSR